MKKITVDGVTYIELEGVLGILATALKNSLKDKVAGKKRGPKPKAKAETAAAEPVKKERRRPGPKPKAVAPESTPPAA